MATIDLKLDNDIKLAIIFNGLSEKYRYLIVALEQQEKIDFDELTARLLEEAKRHGQEGSERTALYTTKKSGKCICRYCGQKGHWKNDCPVRIYRAGLDGDGEEAKGKPISRIVM